MEALHQIPVHSGTTGLPLLKLLIICQNFQECQASTTLGFFRRTERTFQAAISSVSSSIPSPFENSSACQLMVPMNIGQWKGIAILDTGSSYPLVNETMWAGVTGQGDILNPWLRGLLYLADGEGRQRLGWV